MDQRVDQYIMEKERWAKELNLLRQTAIDSGFKEDYKWSSPAYTYNGKNVIGLAAFKEYVGIWFFQGALMNDDKKKFRHSDNEKAKAMRQWVFVSFDEIYKNLPIVEAYFLEALENMKKGLVVKPSSKKPLIIPEELLNELDKNEALSVKFQGLNLTKKREFSNHISSAKQLKTKQSRIVKIIPLIMEGIGLNDKYRKC